MMASVDVKMSQKIWDLALQQQSLDEAGGRSIAGVVYGLEWMRSLSSLREFEPAKAKISPGKIQTEFFDGPTGTYLGAVNQETATSGSAVITSKTIQLKNFYQETTEGKLDYSYEVTDGKLSLECTGEQITSYKLSVLNIFDPATGRGNWELKGDVTVQPDESWSGKIHSLAWSGGRILNSFRVAGDFGLSFDPNSLSYQMNGRVDSLSLAYADKSYLRISGPIAYVDGMENRLEIFSDPSIWSGNDSMSFDFPANLEKDFCIHAGDGDDIISMKGGGGFVDLFGGNGNDRFLLRDILSSVDGGNGIDTVETAFSYSLESAVGVENLTLTGKGHLNASGNALDNVLVGNAGHNVLSGAGGKDVLKGGAGNDTYKIDFSGDVTIDDASGSDKLEISGVFESVSWNGSTLEISGSSALGKNTYTVSVLNAGKVGAIETISYPASGFTGRLSPNQQGSKASDLIIGTSLGDTIHGLDGNDRIDSGIGNDLIVGGRGKDLIRGGQGADVFKLEKLADSPFGTEDELVDFEIGIDKIDLSSIDANPKVKGQQAFSLSEAGPAAHAVWFGAGSDASSLRVFGDVNGDARADFVIALVGTSSPLAASDFIGLV